MTDYIISRLPHYVNQFETSRSQYRCAEATAAMASDIAYPGRFNLVDLMHTMYERYVGPDLASNKNGTTKEEVLLFFQQAHIGFIDMPVNDQNWIFDEMLAQNKQDFAQLITVADESLLIEYGTNAIMHPWPCVGFAHTLLRVGGNDEEPYGWYFDPAASKFCFDNVKNVAKPVKIGRAQVEAARVITAVTIMPPKVTAPPAGFSFQHGVWPVPAKPGPDVAAAIASLSQFELLLTQLKADLVR